MKKEKKIWTLEQCANRVWMIAHTMMQEAARAGNYGRGYAIVAHEATAIAGKLNEYVGRVKFDDVGNDFTEMNDYLMQLRLLSLNAHLETINGVEASMDFNIPKCMMVFTYQLGLVANSLAETFGGKTEKPFVMPELASPVEFAGRDAFFIFSMGGHTLIENVRSIKEIFYRNRADFAKGSLSVRGENLPVADIYGKLNLTQPAGDFCPVVAVELKKVSSNARGYTEVQTIFAVPIDDLDVGFIEFTRIGRSAEVKAGHGFHGYARECWDLLGGEQAVFVDWEPLK